MSAQNNRYRMDVFHARSLVGNPLKGSPERKIKIYLPPQYFTSDTKRYPVIYFLHGYGGTVEKTLIGTYQDLKNATPPIFRLVLLSFFKKLITYEKLDALMLSGQIPPFILVQPGGHLPLPILHAVKDRIGLIPPKGSLYLNSPYTGNYSDYIFQDVIEYIDSNYRTKADKLHRGIVGASMGGYGALYGVMIHPEKFNAVYAISPAISYLNVIESGMVMPINTILFGKRKAVAMGRKDLDDILDTADLIFARDTPLLPTINRDKQGKIQSYGRNAKDLWLRWDLNLLAQKHSEALRSVNITLSCEEQDEFGLADQIRTFQKSLNELQVPHQLKIYDDSYAAKRSPHAVGIAQRVLPAFKFCTKHFH